MGHCTLGVEIIKLMPTLFALRQGSQMAANKEGQGQDDPWPFNIYSSFEMAYEKLIYFL
jgi:hypothetical protein